MTVSDLNSPLAEVLMLIQKGSHTPNSYNNTYSSMGWLHPRMPANKASWIYLHFLSAFGQGCSMLLNNKFLIHMENKQPLFTCFACAPQFYLAATNRVTSPCGQD